MRKLSRIMAPKRPIHKVRYRLFGDSFAPRDLFRGGKSGVFLDLSQPYRFQDAAGTTAATADAAPLGLVYDLKNGVPVLGPELVNNGGFDNSGSGWTSPGGGWSVTNGYAEKNATGADLNGSLTSTTVIGTWYQLQFTVSGAASVFGTIYFRIGVINHVLNYPLSVGTHTIKFPCTAANTFIQFASSGGMTAGVRIDNISLKAIPGSHAYQTTTTARPLLYTTPYYYAKFDLGDDVPNVYLPAITNGTICLLTNKGAWFDTLNFAGGVFSLGPTTYTGGPTGLLTALRNAASDFRLIGMVVIDKALSTAEKTSLVAWGRSKGCPGEITMGAELCANNEFNDLSTWTIQPGWSISGGNAINYSGGSAVDLFQTLQLSSSNIYMSTINVESGGVGYGHILGTGPGVRLGVFSSTGVQRYVGYAGNTTQNYGVGGVSNPVNGIIIGSVSLKQVIFP